MEVSELLARPWYDNGADIDARVWTLKDFHDLVNTRSKAWYHRREDLDWFILFGRFVLDKSGNVGKVVRNYIPADAHPNCPRVMNEQEFARFQQEQGTLDRLFSYGIGNALPPHNVTCPGCEQRWAIENCHQSEMCHRGQETELEPFISKTLGDVKRALQERTDAFCFIQSGVAIRHKDEEAFLGDHDGIDDNYIIRTGDIAWVNMWIYEHPICRYRRLEAELRKRFVQVFADAGFDDAVLDPTKNEYDSSGDSGPWFNAYTPWGSIRIGWRTRVVEISWPSLRAPNLVHLFESEKVTRGNTLIHAQSYEKATYYLSLIRGALN